MASLVNRQLMSQVPYEPAAIPEPGVQVVGTQEAAAHAGMLRDPAQDIERRNGLAVIDRAGPTSGPDSGRYALDRPAMARDVVNIVPTQAEDTIQNLGAHVEQRPGVDMPQGTMAPAFAPRRNSFRLPPPPADENLVIGD